jgi:hypothetical protein
MKHYHFIDGRKDKFGSYQVLWHTGNYQYEIEDRNSKKKIVLQDTTFEDAKQIFLEVCASY